MKIFELFFIILATWQLGVTQAANIMGIYTFDIKSHYLFAQNLLKELALDGHNVTVFTGFETKNLPPNYREVKLNLASLDDFKKTMAKDGSVFNMFSYFNKFNEFALNSTKALLVNDEYKAMVASKNVDVILMNFAENPLFLGVGKELNAPIVITSAQKMTLVMEYYTGAYAHDSFVTNILLPIADEMSFKERLINTLTNWLSRILFEILKLQYKKDHEELFPNVQETCNEVRINAVPLMLVNSHFSLDRPMPYMTNMIETGGMQIPDVVNPLPTDLQKFIDSSKDGVIYFCMGGTLKMKDLDLEKKKIIIEGLKKTKLPVIIKWDDESTIQEFIPKTKFFASNWLPQNDILANPKVKAYVTHGGLLSTTEAVYHGVPIIGIPIFGDQRTNINKFIKRGIAVKLDYENLSAASLSSTINSVIDDKNFAATAKTLSHRFRDRPMTPVQTGKYWIEYILRHGNPDFMKSPAMKLTMIEYFNWDVYLMILGSVLISCYLGWKVSKCIFGKIWSLICRKEQKKLIKNKQS
ncbi:UDP-glycosyltransferase UGT5-like [Culicoides brevitarsis]|uniref:UDP-glycosyltransferase UGT5-like n=1 Tax=Culicoides brevitarsis TaxID=469753 RepID=UPI00307CAD72